MKLDEAYHLAVNNIARHGDTDIVPYPIDNFVFFDRANEVVGVLKELDKDPIAAQNVFPLLSSKVLTAVGYHGFRSAMQIDPLWNAYLLGSVISVGDKIEKARVPVSAGVVYSYRFEPDVENGTLFKRDVGWREFQERANVLARSCQFVLSCDISDFYPRVYHHRIENALSFACYGSHQIKRIMDVLKVLSGGVSYGLPIGGHASRLLAELALNGIDRLLLTDGVSFCRFVDDYRIFANSKEEAYSVLIRLSSLLGSEGLSLQKAKSRIVPSGEFLKTSVFAEESRREPDSETDVSRFLEIRIKYDPYSDSADADYENLRDQLLRFDIVGMLSKELKKGRVDEVLTKQLIKSAKLMDMDVKSGMCESLIYNLDVLYPVFPTVMMFLKSVLPDLDENTSGIVFSRIRSLIAGNSYITKVPNNLAYSIRVLSHDSTDEASRLLNRCFRESDNSAIRRDVILSMANREFHAWVSACREHFSTLASWERRALLIASYVLGDQGRHWRDSIKGTLNSYDNLLLDWAASRRNNREKGLPI